MVDDRKKLPAAPALLPLFRYAATAMAVARIGLGVTALVRPSVPLRPWVGAPADEPAAQVLGRALGARDLVLGLGALAATRPVPGAARSAGAWYAAGALSDALDAAVTAAAWPHLPRATRWLVAASAAGGAVAGAAGVLATILE
jgi:hypothetical protein